MKTPCSSLSMIDFTSRNTEKKITATQAAATLISESECKGTHFIFHDKIFQQLFLNKLRIFLKINRKTHSTTEEKRYKNP